MRISTQRVFVTLLVAFFALSASVAMAAQSSAQPTEGGGAAAQQTAEASTSKPHLVSGVVLDLVYNLVLLVRDRLGHRRVCDGLGFDRNAGGLGFDAIDFDGRCGFSCHFGFSFLWCL